MDDQKSCYGSRLNVSIVILSILVIQKATGSLITLFCIFFVFLRTDAFTCSLVSL